MLREKILVFCNFFSRYCDVFVDYMCANIFYFYLKLYIKQKYLICDLSSLECRYFLDIYVIYLFH